MVPLSFMGKNVTEDGDGDCRGGGWWEEVGWGMEGGDRGLSEYTNFMKMVL